MKPSSSIIFSSRPRISSSSRATSRLSLPNPLKNSRVSSNRSAAHSSLPRSMNEPRGNKTVRQRTRRITLQSDELSRAKLSNTRNKRARRSVSRLYARSEWVAKVLPLDQTQTLIARRTTLSSAVSFSNCSALRRASRRMQKISQRL